MQPVEQLYLTHGYWKLGPGLGVGPLWQVATWPAGLSYLHQQSMLELLLLPPSVHVLDPGLGVAHKKPCGLDLTRAEGEFDTSDLD